MNPNPELSPRCGIICFESGSGKNETAEKIQVSFFLSLNCTEKFSGFGSRTALWNLLIRIRMEDVDPDPGG